ncbi:MAG: DUF6169 family protein [Bacteroidota bacterium]
MEHVEQRELTEQEKEAIENYVKDFDWKRFKEKKVLDDKIFVIECAIERGEINPDELIEKYGLAGRLSINTYKLHFNTKAGSEYIVTLENSKELLGLPVYYICSTEDGQENARKRLFLNWFNTYNTGHFSYESHFALSTEHFFIYNTTNLSAKPFITSLVHKLKK